MLIGFVGLMKQQCVENGIPFTEDNSINTMNPTNPINLNPLNPLFHIACMGKKASTLE
jgi:hypothetical protein